ncbi:hypothetical protein BKA66DRAFT_577445 [Pyrenochaeta sp. MPI-SDFR-AT-0127]|nr:hypothetical protein BKA66DRAFT_577445 [Pyrenochaeta sp. MPI-SDFR-AT-0127]
MPRILTDVDLCALNKAFAATPDIARQAFEKDFIAKVGWPVPRRSRLFPPLADAWIAVLYYGIDRHYKTPQSTYSDFEEQFAVPSKHALWPSHADKLSSVQSVSAAKGWTHSFFADLQARNVRLPPLPGKEFLGQLAVTAEKFMLPKFAARITSWLPRHLDLVKNPSENQRRFALGTRIITRADLRDFNAWVETVSSHSTMPRRRSLQLSDHDSSPSPRCTNTDGPFGRSLQDEESPPPQFGGQSETDRSFDGHAQSSPPHLSPAHRSTAGTACLQASPKNGNSASKERVADNDPDITLIESSDAVIVEPELSLQGRNSPGLQRKKPRLTLPESHTLLDIREKFHSWEQDMDATLARAKVSYDEARTNHDLAIKALEKHHQHLALQYSTSSSSSLSDIISKHVLQIAKIKVRIANDKSYLLTLHDDSADSDEDGNRGGSAGVASAIRARITQDEQRVQRKFQQKATIEQALLNLHHCKDRVTQAQTAFSQADRAWEKEKVAITRHMGWLQAIQTKYDMWQ